MARAHATATNLESLPLVLTVDEARAVLRVGKRQIYEAIRRHELRAVRLGRSLRIPRASLAAWLAGEAMEGTAAAAPLKVVR